MGHQQLKEEIEKLPLLYNYREGWVARDSNEPFSYLADLCWAAGELVAIVHYTEKANCNGADKDLLEQSANTLFSMIVNFYYLANNLGVELEDYLRRDLTETEVPIKSVAVLLNLEVAHLALKGEIFFNNLMDVKKDLIVNLQKSWTYLYTYCHRLGRTPISLITNPIE